MKLVKIIDLETKVESELMESVYNDHYKDSERYELVKEKPKK